MIGLAAALKVKPRNRMAAAELQPLTRAADEERAVAKEKEREIEDRRRNRCARSPFRAADASNWPSRLSHAEVLLNSTVFTMTTASTENLNTLRYDQALSCQRH